VSLQLVLPPVFGRSPVGAVVGGTLGAVAGALGGASAGTMVGSVAILEADREKIWRQLRSAAQ